MPVPNQFAKKIETGFREYFLKRRGDKEEAKKHKLTLDDFYGAKKSIEEALFSEKGQKNSQVLWGSKQLGGKVSGLQGVREM